MYYQSEDVNLDIKGKAAMKLLYTSIKKALQDGCYQPLILSVAIPLTWLGFGNYASPLLLAAFILEIFRKNAAFLFRDRLLIVVLSIFTLNNVVSSLHGINRWESTALSLFWFPVVLVPTSYAGFSVRRSGFFKNVLAPLGLLVGVVIILSLFYQFTHRALTEGVKFGRYTFFWLGKASTPDMLIVLTGMGYGWLRQKDKKLYRWLGFLYLLAGFTGILLTYDRGGMIAFFLIALLLLLSDYKRLLLFFILCALLVYLILTLDVFYILRRMLEFVYAQKERVQLRDVTQIATFKAAWQMIRDHWLLGVGTNNFSKYVSQYGTGKWYAYAHNLVLQFWAENGLFGMITGLTMVGIVLVRWLVSWSQYEDRFVALGVGASVLGILIGNQTNSTLWILKVSIIFWLLCGVVNEIYFVVMHNRAGYSIPNEVIQLVSKSLGENRS